MRLKHIYIFSLVLLQLTCLTGSAQRLIPGSRMDWSLPDSERVIVFRGETTDGVNNACYYLPANFRISVKEGKPEFSFLAWDSDDDGRNDGAIMHMLLTWGLTENQEARISEMMRRQVDSLLYLAGSPVWGVVPGSVDFTIEGENLLAGAILQSLRSQGSPPLSPGEKMALSFFFSPENAAKMEDAIQHPEKLKGIWFTLSFRLDRLIPGESFRLSGDFQKWIMDTRQPRQ